MHLNRHLLSIPQYAPYEISQFSHLMVDQKFVCLQTKLSNVKGVTAVSTDQPTETNPEPFSKPLLLSTFVFSFILFNLTIFIIQTSRR